MGQATSMSTLYLEIVALARCWVSDDGLERATEVLAGMDPRESAVYIASAARLIAMLAEKIGDPSQVLDAVTMDLISSATEGP